MCVALLVLPLVFGLPIELPVAQPESQFEVPLGKPLGDISGLAIDADGRLVTFHRADRHWDENAFNLDNTLNKSFLAIKEPTITVLLPSGKVVEEMGAGLFYMPHGLTVDHNGNYWLTDVGSHQVHKWDAKQKKVTMTLGERLVPGSDDKHFCKPTDVAVASNGFFFVADGYCNSRVLKFDPHGNVVGEIFAAIEDGEPTNFAVPHSLTLVEDMNMLCVADRENERVQCFSAGLVEGTRRVPAGIPITSANGIGRVYAIREKNHYLFGVTTDDEESQVFSMDMESGATNTLAKGLQGAHALDVSDDGTVYVSLLEQNRIVRIPLM